MFLRSFSLSFIFLKRKKLIYINSIEWMYAFILSLCLARSLSPGFSSFIFPRIANLHVPDVLIYISAKTFFFFLFPLCWFSLLLLTISNEKFCYMTLWKINLDTFFLSSRLQMDMKAIGSIYYENFVSCSWKAFFVTILWLTSRLSADSWHGAL